MKKIVVLQRGKLEWSPLGKLLYELYYEAKALTNIVIENHASLEQSEKDKHQQIIDFFEPYLSKGDESDPIYNLFFSQRANFNRSRKLETNRELHELLKRRQSESLLFHLIRNLEDGLKKITILIDEDSDKYMTGNLKNIEKKLGNIKLKHKAILLYRVRSKIIHQNGLVEKNELKKFGLGNIKSMILKESDETHFLKIVNDKEFIKEVILIHNQLLFEILIKAQAFDDTIKDSIKNLFSFFSNYLTIIDIQKMKSSEKNIEYQVSIQPKAPEDRSVICSLKIVLGNGTKYDVITKRVDSDLSNLIVKRFTDYRKLIVTEIFYYLSGVYGGVQILMDFK